MTPRAKALLKSIPILVVAAAVVPAAAVADAYPDRTIKIIAGFPAGSAPDTTARLIGENCRRPGANRSSSRTSRGRRRLAADRVAKSAPDGYTLLMAGNASIVVNLSLYEKLPYDPVKDLLPVSQVSMTRTSWPSIPTWRRSPWPSSWRWRGRNRTVSPTPTAASASLSTWPASSSSTWQA